jgi:hypothetical protein
VPALRMDGLSSHEPPALPTPDSALPMQVILSQIVLAGRFLVCRDTAVLVNGKDSGSRLFPPIGKIGAVCRFP